MTPSSLRGVVSVLALASTVIAGGGAAEAAPACGPLPASTDNLEIAARRELGACTTVMRNTHAEVAVVSGGADANAIRAFIGNHARDFGLASVDEIARAEPQDGMSRFFLRQRVPGLPQAVVHCHATEPVTDEPSPETPWAIRGVGGYWEVCLLSDLASAAKRPRIGESAARAIAVAESRASGDEAPRAGAVAIIARRRHVLHDRRGVIVYRVTVLEVIGARYVDVEADTGVVLGTTWTGTQPTLPASGDRR
jgi:hypothetical protein